MAGPNVCTGVSGCSPRKWQRRHAYDGGATGRSSLSFTFRLVQIDGVIFSGQAVNHDEQIVNKKNAVFGETNHVIFFGSDGTKSSAST